MTSRWTIILAALMAADGVALGAYSAHGLSSRLESLGYLEDLKTRLEWFDTGVRYQIFHSIGLFLVGLICIQTPNFKYRNLAAWAFFAGCFFFSGSLYFMTFASSDWKMLGAVVPVGGMLFLIGWVAIAIGAWHCKDWKE